MRLRFKTRRRYGISVVFLVTINNNRWNPFFLARRAVCAVYATTAEVVNKTNTTTVSMMMGLLS